MKFFWIFIVVIVALAGGYGYYALYRPYPYIYPSYVIQNNSNITPASLPWPTYGQSAIGAVGYGVLATSGLKKATPTASTAKVMAVLSILKKYPLSIGQQGPILTLTNNDVQIYGNYLNEEGSVVNVTAGEKISEYQGLQAILLPSANNMADTMAIWAFGSLQNYTQYANQLAKIMGMDSSHFATDASGFSPNTVSTAHDLVILGLAAMQQPVIAQIVDQKTANVPIAGGIQNYNTLLGKDDIVGIKTGNTDQAATCYIFAATHTLTSGAKVTVVGAIMAAPTLPDVFNDSLALLNASYPRFMFKNVVQAGEVVSEYRPPWSGLVSATAQSNLTALVWQDLPSTPKVSLDVLQPPASQSQLAGVASFTSNTQTEFTNLRLSSNIAAPSIWWRLTHPF
jgi:D-alanyl-D-alanine carboxypeptidase (penicillin-binding protein 5/6)